MNSRITYCSAKPLRKWAIYAPYFRLSIHQRINERQKRNALNINGLFFTVLTQCSYTQYTATHPQVNNGLYHHSGKTHSKYPK